MFTRDDARTLVGIIGNVVALVLFLSPMPTFYGICKKKSVGQYSAAPYLATFVNCGLWVMYGLPFVHPHSTLVVTINGAGLAIEIFYLSLFLAFSDGRKRAKVAAAAAGECLFVAALGVVVMLTARTTKLRSEIVGTVCMVGNIMMYASPLAIMKVVVSTRSVEYMPFFLSLFSFLNGISWTIYALIRFDPFIAVPNGMGAVLGLAQLLLYATFYKSSKRMEAQKKAHLEKGNGPKPNNH
ncbi:hypothetical protein M569_13100, partial [Genlisea aurea]